VAAEAMGAQEHQFVAALSGSPGATWMAADGSEQPEAAAYGIALLSRFPVHSWQVIRLAPVPVRVPRLHLGRRPLDLFRDEPRVAVAATVGGPRGPITVAATHLTFVRWWNGRQLVSLVGSLATAGSPLVLMGDLNMGRARAEQLTGLGSLVTGATFPAHQPRLQLDHILGTGEVQEYAAGGRPHALPLSDHLALSVDLR
jgi:endonuclease/exonuclease/phosphatase family metal-dependent hydrolase